MKKVILVCLTLAFINVNAQSSFEKGTNVISLGGDLGIYNYLSTVGSTNKSDNNLAANKMLTLQYERGIINWLGVGVKLQRSNYFTGTDSVTNTKPSVKAFDALLVINGHFIRAKRVDMYAGFNIGYSALNWEARDAYVSNAKGGGLTYDFHVQPRFYFGNHIGMFINLAYVHYNYQNMDFTNTFTKIDDVLDLTGGGMNFGIGLQAKF